MMKFLTETCLGLHRELEEATAELEAVWRVLAERNVVISREEMTAARAAGPGVAELEGAVSPEVAADRAILRRVFEQLEQLKKDLPELDKLEPPEPAASIAEHEVGIVLGAVYLAAVPTTRPPDEAPERRDEGVALRDRVLAIVDPKDPGASFERAWSALVDAADKYLDRYGQRYEDPAPGAS